MSRPKKETKEQKWLREYAEKMGYEIDEGETLKFREGIKQAQELSEERINFRIPSSLKSEIKAIAKKKNIPYQRYIKSVLIDAVSKEKIS